MHIGTPGPTGPAAGPAPRRDDRPAQGFTMMELSIVIVIIGLLMAGGVAGFSAVMEGRRVAKTASILYQAKQCLLKRMFYSNQYPSYFDGGTAADNTDDLDCAAGNLDVANDVDDCLCNLLDAWGQPLLYLEGAWDDAGSDTRLTGEFITDNPAQAQNATYPDSGSAIVDKDGTTIPGIAFVLISYGRDRIADHTSYRDLFDNAFGGSGTQIAFIKEGGAATPDFSTNNFNPSGTTDDDVRDDQIVYVTGTEIISLLTQ